MSRFLRTKLKFIWLQPRLSVWLPLSVLFVWSMLAIVGPWLPLQPDKINLSKILQPGGVDNLLGYDDLGRSIFDRLVVGARTSFLVGISVVSLSVTVGTVVGLLSAYRGGWFDHLTTSIIDILLAFPGILLAIALAGIMGPGIDNVVIALSLVSWVGYARLTRAQVLSIKQREHVQAAVAMGTNRLRIVFKHLLPLAMAPLIIEASFGVAGVVVAEAGLSFLGLGVQAPEASWGNMIRDGARYLLVAPHMVVIPGIALMLVVMSINMLGDQIRDYFDPKSVD